MQVVTAAKMFNRILFIIIPARTLKDIKDMLFDDLRIDEDIVYSLNKDDLEFLSSLYHSNNVNLLSKLIKKDAIVYYDCNQASKNVYKLNKQNINY